MTTLDTWLSWDPVATEVGSHAIWGTEAGPEGSSVSPPLTVRLFTGALYVPEDVCTKPALQGVDSHAMQTARLK